MPNEYQIRQLSLLKKIIQNYNQNKSLNNLISDIESLIDLLVGLDEAWEEKVRTLWFDLEIIYSMKHSTQSLVLTNEEISEINTILNNLSKLIDEKLTCQK